MGEISNALKEHEIHIISSKIVEEFEELLRTKDINIQCSDPDLDEERQREGVRIYGNEYWDLIDRVEDILRTYIK